MEGINCVKGEIHNVLTVLRLEGRVRHKRSSHSGVGPTPSESGGFSFFFASDGDEQEHVENVLVRDFKDLNDSLGFYRDINEIDTCLYLKPFLDVLVSDDTSPQLTATSLQSIQKFLLYKLINKDSPYSRQSMTNIAYCVNNCKFARMSQEADEVLYMKKMEVLLELVRCPVGQLLTDQAMCSIVEDCLIIRNGARTSAVLRKYAENILSQMILLVFARLVPSDPVSTSSPPASPEIPELLRSKLPVPPASSRKECDESSTGDDTDRPADIREAVGEPYSIPAMQRILQCLTHLINPSIKRRNADGIQEFGLRLINTALESCGSHLGDHPKLMEVVQDELCKQLLHCSQTKHLKILSLTLRIVFDLFNTVKQHLKVQLEVFFTSIHLGLAEGESATQDQKELVMESLVEFCHEPSLIVGIYRNYDCEFGSTNLYEELIKFMSSTAAVNGNEVTQFQLLAGEGILSVMDSIAKRFCIDRMTNGTSAPLVSNSSDDGLNHGELNPEEEAQLRRIREEKKRLRMGAQSFNEHGKNSFPYLQKIHVLSNPLTERSVANFLRNTPGLDKSKAGEYLGSKKPFAVGVLNEFILSFDFNDMSVVDALRTFFESFQLSGEAQQRFRILEAFSARLFKQSPGPINDENAMYLLVSAIIMLNTDKHSPSIKKSNISLTDLKGMLRKTNGDEDFPGEFLEKIYHSISSNEIKMLSEDLRTIVSEGKGVDKRHWTNLLSKSRSKGAFKTSAPPAHGHQMFTLLWDSAIHVLCFHLRTSDHPKMLQRIEGGFRTFARICSIYDLNAIFNNLLISLSNIACALLEECALDVRGYDPQVAFGRSERAQRATQLLFSLTMGYAESNVLDAWTNIVHTVLWLHHLKLLPDGIFELDDFRDATGRPLPSVRYNEPELGVTEEGPVESTWGVIKSLLLGSEEETDEKEQCSIDADDHLDDDKCRAVALSVVADCNVQSIFEGAKHLQPRALTHLTRTLIAAANNQAVDRLTSAGFSAQVLNDEAAVFCLERLFDVVERNVGRLHVIWPLVKSHFELIVSQPHGAYPNYFMERVVVVLIRLCSMILINEKITTNMWADIIAFLGLLAKLDDNMIEAFGDRITAGLSFLLKTDKTDSRCFSSGSDWSAVMSLLERCSSIPKAAFGAFETVECIVDNCVTAENFLPCLHALVSFLGSPSDPSAHALTRESRVLEVMLNLHCKLGSIESSLTETNSNGAVEANKMHPSAEVSSLVTDLWIQTIDMFCRLARDPRYIVRKRALDCLQRALLACPNIHITSAEALKSCFERLLVPLLVEMDGIESKRIKRASTSQDMQPKQNPGAAPRSAMHRVEDLRLRIGSIVFQTFLHNATLLASLQHFHLFWLKFIGSLERYLVKRGSEAVVSIHFTESLKNILLVMRSNGLFVQASRQSGQDIWSLTWALIGSFRPDLRKEFQNSHIFFGDTPSKSPQGSSESSRSNISINGHANSTSTNHSDSIPSKSPDKSLEAGQNLNGASENKKISSQTDVPQDISNDISPGDKTILQNGHPGETHVNSNNIQQV
eukprot:114846_1